MRERGIARRCFVQAATDKVAGSRVGTGVTGAQRPVPELLSMTFETEDRMIGRTSFGFGVVAQAGTLLFAIQRQHH